MQLMRDPCCTYPRFYGSVRMHKCLFLGWNKRKRFCCYLHEEEGHSICLKGPGKLHIFYFSLYLRHLSAVFMVLEKQMVTFPTSYANILDIVYLLHYICILWIYTATENKLKILHAAFGKCNIHTWNIFFSAPLCLIYSLGRNSFRLRR